MKTRIFCNKHNRRHSKHADYHCKNGTCTPERIVKDTLYKGEYIAGEYQRTRCPVALNKEK